MNEGITSSEIEKLPMLFILGSSRSGTTLMQEMLDSHPQIVGPPESDFILFLYPKFGGIKRWTEKTVHDFVEDLFSLPRISKIWLLNKANLFEELIRLREGLNYQLACKIVFLQKKNNKENILLISDKDPRNSYFANKLLGIFPEARFIHIIRDPRDVINGHIKRLKKKNTFFISRQWVGLNQAIEKVKEQFPQQFITVIYEKMVTNPNDTFKLLCEFLNVPYDNSIMKNKFAENVENLKEEAIFERYKEIHESLLKPINASNIGKWKTELDEYDLAVTENITGKYAKEKYGYLLGESKPNKHISAYRLFKTKVVYALWEGFTKARYNWYKFNSYYRKNYLKGYGL